LPSLIEPGDTAEAKEVPSISNKTLLPDAGDVPHPQPSEAKEAGADDAVSDQPSDKPQLEAVGKSVNNSPSTLRV
jgi:hypothetical protein